MEEENIKVACLRRVCEPSRDYVRNRKTNGERNYTTNYLERQEEDGY